MLPGYWHTDYHIKQGCGRCLRERHYLQSQKHFKKRLKLTRLTVVLGPRVSPHYVHLRIVSFFFAVDSDQHVFEDSRRVDLSLGDVGHERSRLGLGTHTFKTKTSSEYHYSEVQLTTFVDNFRVAIIIFFKSNVALIAGMDHGWADGSTHTHTRMHTHDDHIRRLPVGHVRSCTLPLTTGLLTL